MLQSKDILWLKGYKKKTCIYYLKEIHLYLKHRQTKSKQNFINEIYPIIYTPSLSNNEAY